jgi:trimeric autotransporter adhesin
MSLTRKKPAELNTSGTIKAAQRARKASSAAAANAAIAAQNAALTAQNAASMAQVAAQNAAVVATNAAHSASDTAQMAAVGLSKGVRQGVYTARSWAAPRLDSAADYTTATVAPKVSTALHNTARQVRPAEPASSKRSTLTWSLLGASILAAVGAGAAVARYRYRAAIAADSKTADEEVMADSSGSQAAPVPADEIKSKGTKPEDGGAETSVNGQVPASGR